MSIAADLEKTSIRLRGLLGRSHEEIVQSGPGLLREIDLILDRIRGFEAVAVIRPDHAMPEEGDRHD